MKERLSLFSLKAIDIFPLLKLTYFNNFILMKNTIYILALTFLLCGCKEKSTEPEKPFTGTADFSVYVAIGNSVTAGFQSNSLYQEGQEYSYANLLAKQVNTPFIQPTMSEPGVHEYRLRYQSRSSSGWFLFDKQYERGEPANSGYEKPYNNLAVPGARVKDVLNATNMFTADGGINPFFDLVLRNFENERGSQFRQARILQPTFLTLWIGNNDILGFAMGGAAGSKPMSDDQFHKAYKELADSIKTLGAAVLTANIPDVTVLPYFTAIMNVDTSAVFYGETDAGVRMLKRGADFITLQASSLLFSDEGTSTGRGRTASDPLPDRYVLDASEIDEIRTILAGFNHSIKTISDASGFIMVDIFTLYNQLKNFEVQGGYKINGIILRTDFVTGGLFSYDGIHPSSRAHGIIANAFIDVINNHFNASVPLINISDIPDNVPLKKDYRVYSGNSLP